MFQTELSWVPQGYPLYIAFKMEGGDELYTDLVIAWEMGRDSLGKFFCVPVVASGVKVQGDYLIGMTEQQVSMQAHKLREKK